MSYIPEQTLLGYQAVTTSEALSGRNVDGVASYVKIIKTTGFTGTGTDTIAHGITGATRWVSLHVGVKDGSPQWFAAGLGTWSNGGSRFGLAAAIDGTNAYIFIGTSWASTNALRDAWVLVEYLK